MSKIKKRVKAIKIAISLVALFFLVGLAGGFVWEYYGSSFSSGTFNNTLYNSTGNYVYLNWTDATNTSYVQNGTYTSTIIDFGVTTGFRNIKWQGYQRACPSNMSYIDKFGGYCIDQYEAYNKGSSIAGSAPGQTPWASVSQINARTYCANAGKHLCTSEEWLGAANIKGQVYYLPTGAVASEIPTDGNSNTRCNTNSACTPCLTGSRVDCVSAEGVYDMIGNVVEWVNETIDTIAPSGCTTCYINNTGGWQSGTTNTDKYGSDAVYFSSGTNTNKAVDRGGSWAVAGDAGLFYASLDNAPTDADSNIGFRCCSSPLES